MRGTSFPYNGGAGAAFPPRGSKAPPFPFRRDLHRPSPLLSGRKEKASFSLPFVVVSIPCWGFFVKKILDGFSARRAEGCAACAPQEHPPIFFPEKENGRCDRPKERRLHCQPFLEKLLCLPMLLPARGVAALALLYDLPLLLLSAAALPIL